MVAPSLVIVTSPMSSTSICMEAASGKSVEAVNRRRKKSKSCCFVMLVAAYDQITLSSPTGPKEDLTTFAIAWTALTLSSAGVELESMATVRLIRLQSAF